MKLKFLKPCNDKYNGTVYEVDKEYDFEEQRANEILATGYAEVVEAKVEPKKVEEKKEDKKSSKKRK